MQLINFIFIKVVEQGPYVVVEKCTNPEGLSTRGEISVSITKHVKC